MSRIGKSSIGKVISILLLLILIFITCLFHEMQLEFGRIILYVFLLLPLFAYPILTLSFAIPLYRFEEKEFNNIAEGWISWGKRSNINSIIGLTVILLLFSFQPILIVHFSNAIQPTDYFLSAVFMLILAIVIWGWYIDHFKSFILKFERYSNHNPAPQLQQHLRRYKKQVLVIPDCLLGIFWFMMFISGWSLIHDDYLIPYYLTYSLTFTAFIFTYKFIRYELELLMNHIIDGRSAFLIPKYFYSSRKILIAKFAFAIQSWSILYLQFSWWQDIPMQLPNFFTGSLESQIVYMGSVSFLFTLSFLDFKIPYDELYIEVMKYYRILVWIIFYVAFVIAASQFSYWFFVPGSVRYYAVDLMQEGNFSALLFYVISPLFYTIFPIFLFTYLCHRILSKAKDRQLDELRKRRKDFIKENEHEDSINYKIELLSMDFKIDVYERKPEWPTNPSTMIQMVFSALLVIIVQLITLI